MNIIVLLKQVPSTESDIRIAEGGMDIRTETINWVINPYDEFAVEEALRIRETHGGTVSILSVGPERTVDAIRSALALGADTGLLIQAEGCDGLSTAKLIAAALKQTAFDLIIAGQRAVDDDQSLVGPAVAELLKIPLIPMVVQEQIVGGKIRCRRSLEGGSAVIETSLPMLFTTQRGLNEPRYASLPGILKAKKKPIEIKTPQDFGFPPLSDAASQTPVVQLRLPPGKKTGTIIEAETVEEKALELVKRLREMEKVI